MRVCVDPSRRNKEVERREVEGLMVVRKGCLHICLLLCGKELAFGGRLMEWGGPGDCSLRYDGKWIFGYEGREYV